MAYVIDSVEEFLTHLKVGDTFWWMMSLDCKPIGVDEPHTIKRMEDSPFFGIKDVKIFYDSPSFLNPGTMVEDHFYVSDITNQWHGVFLTEESALEYFGERAWAYAIDPMLRAEVEEAKKDDDVFEDWSTSDKSWASPEDEEF
ncbi:MAG: hypothetical protein G01um101429_264 [Parcubacteria group bacterium Gr01-1014_29]|nr:MAG: hypothetical protein G01um101429_264 [Parcubacteria group bacterium Gr01-1014_29]